MKKYRIFYSVHHVLTVEADNEDEALEMAMEADTDKFEILDSDYSVDEMEENENE